MDLKDQASRMPLLVWENKRVAHDTLIETIQLKNLWRISHEIGHYKKKHIVKGMIVSIVHSAILFFYYPYFYKRKGCLMHFIWIICLYMGD